MKRPGLIEHKRNLKFSQIPVSLQLPVRLKKKPNLLESSYWKKEFKNLLLGKTSANKRSSGSNRKKHREYYLKQKFSSSLMRQKREPKLDVKKHSQLGRQKMKVMRNHLGIRKELAEDVQGKRNLKLVKLSKIRSAAELLIPEERRGIKINLKGKEANSTKESNQILLSSINRKKRLILESKAERNRKGPFHWPTRARRTRN